MAIQALNVIKDWFKQGFYPTENQFSDTWDSFVHKLEKLPTSAIDGLTELFNAKADKEALDTHLNDPDAHGIAGKIANKAPRRSGPLVIEAGDQDDGTYELIWTPALKETYGEYGFFLVIQENSIQNVPISFTVDGDGKPSAYTFQLDNVNTLIFIT